MKRTTAAAIGVSGLLLAGAAGLSFAARRGTADALSEYCTSADESFRAGRVTVAVTEYNRAIAVAPREPRSYIGLAVLYETLNRSDLAIEALEQLRAAAPAARHLYCRLSEAHLGVEDVRAARDWGSVAVEREPECPRACSTYGIALARGRYWETASLWLRRAAELAPQDLGVREALVDVLLESGRYDDAIRVGREVAGFYPGSARVQYALGRAFGRLAPTAGNTAAALEHLRAAARLAPGWYEPLAEQGRLHQSLGQHGLALAAFERAHQLAPNASGVLNNLALLRERTGAGDAAALRKRLPEVARSAQHFTALRVRYSQEPENPERVFPLVAAERKVGRYATALHRLRKLLRQDPANGRALRLYLELDHESRSGFPDYLRPGPGIGPVQE